MFEDNLQFFHSGNKYHFREIKNTVNQSVLGQPSQASLLLTLEFTEHSAPDKTETKTQIIAHGAREKIALIANAFCSCIEELRHISLPASMKFLCLDLKIKAT